MEYKIESNSMGWERGKAKGFSRKDFLQLENGDVKMVKVESMSLFPLHVHTDKTEYIFVIEGTPEFTIEQDVFLAKAGDFFIFPSSVEHAIKNNTLAECLLLIGTIKI